MYYMQYLFVHSVTWSKIQQNSSFKSSNYELKRDDGNTSKPEMQYFIIFHSKIGDLYIKKSTPEKAYKLLL